MKAKKFNLGVNLIMAFALLFISYNLSAQYSYQSVVRDANGDLVANQSIGLKIKIYEKNNLGGGIADVYEETHTVTTNENGLVSLIIGEGTAVSGSMNDIEWSGIVVSGPIYVFTNYIQVKYDLTGGTNYTLTTDEIIREVPKATFAKEAKSANNGAIAMASVKADGTIYTSKGITSVTQVASAGFYKIVLTSGSYDKFEHVVVATPSGGKEFINIQGMGGELLVYIYDENGVSSANDFQIVVFKP